MWRPRPSICLSVYYRVTTRFQEISCSKSLQNCRASVSFAKINLVSDALLAGINEFMPYTPYFLTDLEKTQYVMPLTN